MDPLSLAVGVISQAVSQSFQSLFAELDLSTDMWFRKAKTLTIGKKKYSQHMAESVGVFPLFATTRSTTVDHAYVELAVSRDVQGIQYRDRASLMSELTKSKSGATDSRPGLAPLAALNESSRGFALIGAPGSGKTTAFRHLALQTARGALVRNRRRLPIFLSVRDMASDQVSIDLAVTSLFLELEFASDEKTCRRLYEELGKEGALLVLLDGMDETSELHQKRLIKELTAHRSKFQKSLFAVSGRPRSLLVGLPGFDKFETLPLSFAARQHFIKKWYEGASHAKGVALVAESSRRSQVLDLGSSPLLLSIVCALYENDLNIPDDEDELNRRCVEGLLGGWDTFRMIARASALKGLTIERRKILVSWLAASLFTENLLVFSSEDSVTREALKHATAAVQQPSIEPSRVLDSLAEDFGILARRSQRFYSFSHLTLQEFLVASYIVDQRRENILLEADYRRSQRWSEVICRVARLLPNAEGFMRKLFHIIDLSNDDDVVVWRSCWETRPVVAMTLRLDLMTDVVRRATKMLPKDADHPDNAVLKNHHPGTLPDILWVIQTSGFTSQELGVGSHPFWAALVPDIDGSRPEEWAERAIKR